MKLLNPIGSEARPIADARGNGPIGSERHSGSFPDEPDERSGLHERQRAAEKLRLAIQRAERQETGEEELAAPARLLAVMDSAGGHARQPDDAERPASAAGTPDAVPQQADAPVADRRPAPASGTSTPDAILESGASQLVAASCLPPAALAADPPRRGGAPAAGAAEARINTLVERIEAAWRNQFALRPSETIRLQLRLEGETAGTFNGLSVAISPVVLDVTLMGIGGAAPSPALLEAAQALAQRLHQRFPERLVRVIGGDDEDSPSTGGLAAFSQILRRPGGQA